MLAAQALKQRRAQEEDLERHFHEHHHPLEHRQHEDVVHDGDEGEHISDGEGEKSDLEEEEPLVEVPKYLQGIPLVDSHAEIEGVSLKNIICMNEDTIQLSGNDDKKLIRIKLVTFGVTNS